LKIPETHIIKSLTYSLSLDDEEEAHAYPSKISRMQAHHIEVLLTKVMDAYHSPEYLDQYDSITLELGTIPASNFETELRYKIEEHFSAFFKTNITLHDTLVNGKRTALKHTQLDHLLFFLKYGHLPWAAATGLSPKTLLINALQHHKDTLIAHLKTLGLKAGSKQRLITQFDDATLESLTEAILKDEGPLINAARQELTNYQKYTPISNVNASQFRLAVWELTLEYVLTTTKGISNGMRFLSYLMPKIALRYNLSYKDLLKHIALGILENTKPQNSKSVFEQLILTLYGKIETAHSKLQLKTADTDENFISILAFFLKHEALPAYCTIQSASVFYEQLKATLYQDKEAFYTLFFSNLKTTPSQCISAIKQFPNTLINTIIANANSNVFSEALAFYKMLNTTAQHLQITSITLNALNAHFGIIVLDAYSKNTNTSNLSVVLVLDQIVRTQPIDAGFLQILKHTAQLPKFTAKQDVLQSIAALTTLPLESSSKRFIPSLTTYAKRLYTYYQGKRTLTLEQFEMELSRQAYFRATSYKLALSLLETYNKQQAATVETLSEWIRLRLIPLETKGTSKAVLIAEVTQLLQLTAAAPKLLKAVSQTQNALATTNTSTLNTSKPKNSIPKRACKQFIQALNHAFFKRSTQDLYVHVRALLLAFSKEYEVSETTVLSKLKTEAPQYSYRILKHIISTNASTVANKHTALYDLELYCFYAKYGKLPWWSASNMLTDLQHTFNAVLQIYPEKFIANFKTSSHQSLLMALVDSAIFNSILMHVHPRTGTAIVGVFKVFETLLKKDLSGIKRATLAFTTTLKHEVLKMALQTNTLECVAVAKHLTLLCAKNMTLPKAHIHQLLLGRLQAFHTHYEVLQPVIQWLSHTVSLPDTPVLNTITAKASLEDWKATFAVTDAQALVGTLHRFYKDQPEIFYSYLRQITFRTQLIKQLNFSTQKRLLTLLFPIAEHHTLLFFFDTFKQLRGALQTPIYQQFWTNFIDLLFLNRAIVPEKTWTTTLWTRLYFESIQSLSQTDTSAVFETVLQTTASRNVAVTKALKRFIKEDTTAATNVTTVLEVLEEETIGDAIFIENAGLVILGPYIPMLFERMQLTTQGAFNDTYCQCKALYALQYAATGTLDHNEQALALNKLICGMPLHAPVRELPELTAAETTLIDGMLNAIISHWSTIGNTSVEGLRSSFLYRPGRLIIEEKKYILSVEARAFDMLLDSIPWTIGQLKLHWMPQLIEVLWRT
jgi:hypothetical protein